MHVLSLGLIVLVINITRWTSVTSHDPSTTLDPRDIALLSTSPPRYGTNAFMYCNKRSFCGPVSRPQHTCTVLLLVLCGDVQTNPGPRPPKYPCGICSRAVRHGQEGIQCDHCDDRYHVQCIHMSTPVYIALQNSDVSWLCDHCGMPNFSSGLFAPSISESQNSFAALSDSNMNTSSSAMDLGSPVHASSPNTQRPPTRKGTPLLKVLSLNCNSVKGKDKNCEFCVLIDQHDPLIS